MLNLTLTQAEQYCQQFTGWQLTPATSTFYDHALDLFNSYQYLIEEQGIVVELFSAYAADLTTPSTIKSGWLNDPASCTFSSDGTFDCDDTLSQDLTYTTGTVNADGFHQLYHQGKIIEGDEMTEKHSYPFICSKVARSFWRSN